MKVICARFSKTGTTSLAKALQVLGYNVYDFQEHYEFHFQQWLDSFETDRHPNFKDIYQEVDAVTDVPPAFWFEEISADFPEAKIILTIRDSEDAWLKSWKEHLQLISEMKTLFTKPLFIIVPWMRKSRHFVDTFLQAVYGSANPEATAECTIFHTLFMTWPIMIAKNIPNLSDKSLSSKIGVSKTNHAIH